MNLLKSNWVQSQYEDDPTGWELLERRVDSAEPVLELLRQWAQLQKSTIDAGLKSANLKDKPDRAELALMGVSQKEILDNLLNLLDK